MIERLITSGLVILIGLSIIFVPYLIGRIMNRIFWGIEEGEEPIEIFEWTVGVGTLFLISLILVYFSWLVTGNPETIFGAK